MDLCFPYAGASTVLFPGKAQAKAVLGIAQTARPTLFFSVPTLYAQMLQEAERESYCLDSLRIVDSDDREVPPGTIGDLLVSGDSIAPRYWNRRPLFSMRRS
jgi:acyl-coenzyme A synthetase/AMP-(fatty) acid ligase